MKKKITIELSELDLSVLLVALGNEQVRRENTRRNIRAIAILTERIYRAMGVRL